MQSEPVTFRTTWDRPKSGNDNTAMINQSDNVTLDRPVSSTGIDLELVKKYNVPGPRYTSYPTAVHFHDDVDQESLLRDLTLSARAAFPLSLYFHLPFCASACWFCGCTRVITRSLSAPDRYLDYLEKEIALTLPHTGPDRNVVQMHFGGGTPSYFSPEQVARLEAIIRDAFQPGADSENSVEIDPRRIGPEHIEAWRRLGCNRASLGVQDNNPRVQQAINRIQPREVTEQVVGWLREAGFRSINIDLIYGLPHQTVASFSDTLEEVLALAPDRLAVFNYAHVPWIKPAQKIFDRRGGLPDSSTKLAILEKVAQRLADEGYVYIGMDHFARAGDDLSRAQAEGTLQRNFQGYSTSAGTEILGFGMSSISQTPNTYRQNIKELHDYYDALDEGRLPWTRGRVLSREDRIRREVISRLMCDLKLDFDIQSQSLGIDFESHFHTEIRALKPMERDGLIQWEDRGFAVTPAGRFLIRNIAMVFDAYLERSPTRYSRTV